MSKVKNILRDCLLVLAGLAVALLLAEGVLRVYNPFGFRMRGDRIVPPVNFHYTVDNHGIAGVDPKVVHAKNSLGFRGADPPADFAKQLSIFVVGGSTTECFYLSDGKDWPVLAGRMLDETFKDLWLNNAGLDGNSPLGHLILVKDLLLPLKPKVVAFLVGLNEIGNTKGTALDTYFQKGLSFASPSEFLRTLANYSEVLSLAYNLYRYYKSVEVGVVHQNLRVDKLDRMEVGPEKAREALAGQARALEAYRLRLDEIIKACREAGALPMLITQPALPGPGRDPTTGVDLAAIGVKKGMNGGLFWQVLERYNQLTRDEA